MIAAELIRWTRFRDIVRSSGGDEQAAELMMYRAHVHASKLDVIVEAMMFEVRRVMEER